LTAMMVGRAREGKHHDGLGLYLLVHKGGSRSWAFRYGAGGKTWLGLGPTHTISLAQARERARGCRQSLLDGVDPAAAKRERNTAARLAAAKSVSFSQAAAMYFDSHRAGWKSPKHAAEWKSTLAMYAYPVIGELPVASIDVGLVLKMLEPIWATKSVTASRVRARVEAVLDFAKARGLREGENPARWRGHLDHLLPAASRVSKIKHFAALPYSEIGEFMDALRSREGVAPRALEFLVLTAARSGEVLGAAWNEIDLAAKTWTIPADRMKSDREHKVPLSGAAIALLKALPRVAGNDHAFAGARKGQGLGKISMYGILHAMGRADVTAHGFRSTFRDWAAETTGYPNHVVEMALAHTVGSAVEAAYRRGDLFEKRRKLMDDWARFCSLPAAKGDVVALRRG
jgi:integrase